MSAIARYFIQLNKTVMGYDKTQTKLTNELEKEGIDIHFSDDINFIPEKLSPENTVVIYTPAVPKNHAELQFFIDNKFTVIKRSEALGWITKDTKCLAVAGTHGKTSTSALLGHILKVAELSSTAFVGGIVENYNSNIILGGEDITVVEADEYDKSFLKLKPNFACITSTDADHLDIYGEKENLEESFREFASIVSEKVIAKKGLNIPNAYTYSVEEKADYFADNIQLKDDFFIFDFNYLDGKIEKIKFHLPGKHNIENAVAAIALAQQLGVTDEQIKKSLDSFKGVKRRFSRHSSNCGKIIIDDYAHHPTELNAIISATKNFYPNREILGVFQPHLFSRTRDFLNEFAESLSKLDDLILLEIYPARELPIKGIDSNLLAKKIKEINGKTIRVVALNEALTAVLEKESDVILLMGAGNIDTLYEPLKQKLR